MFGQVNQACRHARDSCGQRTFQRGVPDHVILSVAIHPFMRQGRRGFPAVYHHLLAVGGAVYQPETATAETGTERLHHAQGGADRNRRIKRVSPFPQNLHACRGCQGMCAGDGMGRRALRPARSGADEHTGKQP